MDTTNTTDMKTTINWLEENGLSIAELMPKKLISRMETTARRVPEKRED